MPASSSQSNWFSTGRLVTATIEGTARSSHYERVRGLRGGVHEGAPLDQFRVRIAVHGGGGMVHVHRHQTSDMTNVPAYLKSASLFFDFDSTIVSVEGIDELAQIALANAPDRAARVAAIHAITNAGMEGAIPIDESLR